MPGPAVYGKRTLAGISWAAAEGSRPLPTKRPAKGALPDGHAPLELLALAGVQLDVMACLVDGVGPAVPGLHADEALGVLLPEHAVGENALVKADRDLVAVAGVGEAHRALDAGHQADGVGTPLLTGQGDGLGRGGLLALGAFAAGGGVDVKRDVVQLAGGEVRVEADAERQGLVAGVGDGQGQRGGAAGQGVAHGQGKIERVDELCQTVGGQGQLNGGVARALDLPRHEVGQAVDLDGIGRAVEVVHAVVRFAAVREQDGDAAARAIRGLEVFVAQPQVFVAVFGEGCGHAALLGRDGEGVLAVGQGQGLVGSTVFFIGAGSQSRHDKALLCMHVGAAHVRPATLWKAPDCG